MRFNFPKIPFPFFERNIKGDSFYQVNQYGNWGCKGTNLAIAENHPILTPALLFISKLFSQGEFYLEDKNTKERIYDHWVLDLLEKPNYYQTGLDFLESLSFIQIAAGKSVVWLRRTTGMAQPTAMYLLNPDLIEYPDDFTTPLSRKNDNNSVAKRTIVYDRDGQNEIIKIKDLLFFYDLPNGIHTKNMFESRSRLDGLKQTLVNTNDSLLAKNIILKTNGKELITGSKGGQGTFPLGDAEKQDAEKLFFTDYGLGQGRKRGLLTKADLKWQSLHIALRDLGLDESVKVDGNLIYTALHIPKDILSLEAKKTTYNNFKESMASYVQNEIQATMNSTASAIQEIIPEKNLKLVGTYENLPIMQFILLEKYEGILKRATALQALRNAGVPDELALDICNFPKDTKLAPLVTVDPNSNSDKKEESKRLEEMVKELIDVELAHQ